MKLSIIVATIVFSVALVVTSAYAAEPALIVETPQHGLGLLLDTPQSPVGGIYGESSSAA